MLHSQPAPLVQPELRASTAYFDGIHPSYICKKAVEPSSTRKSRKDYHLCWLKSSLGSERVSLLVRDLSTCAKGKCWWMLSHGSIWLLYVHPEEVYLYNVSIILQTSGSHPDETDV
jgi:hypothetical protein